MGLGLFVLAAVGALFPLVRFRWPSREEGLSRLDRGSGIRHRPATALTDTLGTEDPVAQALWRAQRQRTLFLAENFPQKLATVKLARDLRSARLVDVVGSPALDIPSSVEEDSGDLFGLNARFTTPVTPTTRYDIVRVHR